MIRERVLTLSTVLALIALSGAAQAGPRITDKNYWLNEIGPSSQSAAQAQPDWYRARAMQPGQYRCRYLGGPKSPQTC